jgi:hypothetical protein
MINVLKEETQKIVSKPKKDMNKMDKVAERAFK